MLCDVLYRRATCWCTAAWLQDLAGLLAHEAEGGLATAQVLGQQRSAGAAPNFLVALRLGLLVAQEMLVPERPLEAHSHPANYAKAMVVIHLKEGTHSTAALRADADSLVARF